MYLPDDKSMYCLSTPAYKPDYKSFKFNDHPEEMKGLKTDKKPSLKFESSIISGLNRERYEADSDSLPDDCQNEDLDRNPPAVSGSTAWMDSEDKRDLLPQFSNPSRDTNQSEERKNLHNTESTVVNELPELDVFFHESSYQFVKDICIDSGLSSQGKCLLENCDLDHNSISRLLNSDVDTNSELTEESLETASSVSNGSRHSTEQGCNKDEIKQRSSKGFMVKDEPNFDERYEISDHSHNKIITEIQLPVGEAPSVEAALENSIVSSTTEAVNNSHPNKTSSKSEVEGRSITNSFNSSTTTIRSGEELPRGAACQQPQTGMLSSSINGPLSGLPKSGSISHRSTSSTASSHSFAFPILPGEWTGSPVRMAKADGGQLPKHRRWRLCFPCLQF